MSSCGVVCGLTIFLSACALAGIAISANQYTACRPAAAPARALAHGWQLTTNCSVVSVPVVGFVHKCNPPVGDPSRFNTFWCAAHPNLTPNTAIARVSGMLANNGTAVSGLACCVSPDIAAVDRSSFSMAVPALCSCGDGAGLPPQTGDPLMDMPGMPPRALCATAANCDTYFAQLGASTTCGVHNTLDFAMVHATKAHVSSQATRCAAASHLALMLMIALLCISVVLLIVSTCTVCDPYNKTMEPDLQCQHQHHHGTHVRLA